ncbi:MAG TPA: hypothetical protein VN281_17925 [Verrucomicrobiae bacterium]|jgi:hypothetical protein|nr:hypothetical protein [Verrucomicrobiae bacterium]
MTSRQKIFVRRLFLALAGIAVLSGLSWKVLRTRIPDPIYQGKPLSSWIESYTMSTMVPHQPGISTNLILDQADLAVRDAGTNALPRLLRCLRAHDNFLKRKLIALAESQHFVKSPFVADYRQHWLAVCGFNALGPDGRCAIPELERIYDEHPGQDPQGAILIAISHMGQDAKEAVPLLIGATKSPAPQLRMLAISALNEIRVQPEVTLPVLMTSLNDSNKFVQWSAVQGLGRIGSRARAALPRLLELRHDQSSVPGRWCTGPPTLAESVEDALKTIDPEGAVAHAEVK